MCEQPGPVLAAARIETLAEPLTPEVLGPFLAVPVMRVSPEPCGERLVLVCGAIAPGHTRVGLGLGGEQPFPRRARGFARIPRMIGL